MSNLKRKSIGILMLGVLGVAGIATTFAAGRTYVQYCSGTVSSPVCSGGYQDDIDAARTKAAGFMREIRSYSSSEQTKILDSLITRLALYHMTTNSAYDQVIASYYHDYFKNERSGGSTSQNVDDIIRQLIGSSSTTTTTSTSSRSSNRPNDGVFTSITPGSSSTTIRNSRITARGELNLTIVAKERNVFLQNTDVRIVAELFDGNRKVDTVAANERNASRSLVLSDQFDRVDEIRLYLLCDNCTRGSNFQGTLFNNWKVLDTEQYDVSLTRTTRYDDRYYYDDDGYSDERYDLEIRSIDYQYDNNGREVDVQVEVTVRNIGELDNTLDRLEYEIEVDGRRLSSSRYDINHIRTTCDDRGVDRDDTRNLPIDENDECTILVEIVFDEDDVEDEYVEIFVEAIARRDDNTRNNEEEVRFLVD